MSLNVLVINDFAYVSGGASKIAINTAIGLKKRGHEVIFFSAVPPIDEELKNFQIRIINTEQYDILSHPNRFIAAIQGLWNKKAANSLSELLNKLNPRNTILHFHSWMKALSPSVLFKAVKSDFKNLITIHDYFLFCPNGGFFNFKENEICNEAPMKIRCIIKNCDSRNYYHKLWRLIRQLIQNNVLSKVTDSLNLIFPSNLSKEIAGRYFKTNKLNFTTIANPINVKRDLPVSAYRNESFVYVGRLSREKGVLLFAKAASQLKIKAVFIGDGYLKDEILKTCPNAVITGWIPEAKVQEILKSARVLVYPSLCYETQGLAVLEAKAMGIPTIVSDSCVAREYIKDNLEGFLFRGGDLNALIDKLRICYDDSIVEKIGRKAYENYWEDPFTIESYVDSIERLYIDIIGQK